MQGVGIKHIAAGMLAAMTLAATAAWAAVAGVVTAISPRAVTVSGAAYELHEDTSFQDMTGRPISFGELRPGIAVELEFDEDARLVVVRASVVR